MSERWRQPVVPLAVEPHDKEILVLPDGRKLRQSMIALKPADIERLRAGYVCLKCFEPFETAWPERCPVCGAPVRKEQAAYFARELGAELRLGPSTSLDEERERLREAHLRKDDDDGS